MLDEQVKSVMGTALRSVSKGKNVGLKELRIKMELTSELDSTCCFALQKTKELSSISWSKVLGLKAIGFKRSIVGQITNRLHELAEKFGLDKNDVNVRVYAVDSKGTPNVYLYDAGKPLEIIDINELL